MACFLRSIFSNTTYVTLLTHRVNKDKFHNLDSSKFQAKGSSWVVADLKGGSKGVILSLVL